MADYGGIGFTAIALALVAGLRPSGVVMAALLFVDSGDVRDASAFMVMCPMF